MQQLHSSCSCHCSYQHKPTQQQHIPLPQQPTRVGTLVIARSSIREPKDPSKFASMDEARAYLMEQRYQGGPIAGALNWLSNAAFGAGRAGMHLGYIYRQWLSHQQEQQQRSSDGASSASAVAAAAAAVAAAGPDALANLALVMLVSEHRVQQLACKYPQVLSMPSADVASRLLLLKELLPSCDVARMVELAPGLLLSADASELHAAKQRVDVLTSQLPGADIATMVQEDPSIMFEDLETSFPRFYELWPNLEPTALAASDPKQLALALRALSDQGPPRRF